jgi:hypothetical protein
MTDDHKPNTMKVKNPDDIRGYSYIPLYNELFNYDSKAAEAYCEALRNKGYLVSKRGSNKTGHWRIYRSQTVGHVV